ncbi:unnamed protein product [Rotaria sordida]|uniref:Uncharacterized protein n=1 Tax=Rotaria sordida TaxID=392033 RepID=A0A813MPL3_9BILA|nr:unnamed protein product [Rotaria sordida]CAF0909195.1 unnamed protein product [Rotaria sordida]
MKLNYFLLINFFDIFLLIHTNEPFYFGIINHHTEWYFHCLQNFTKILNPPLNNQPLISYECPYPSLTMEILPLEIDFTLLCRLQSRLIWIIIDLYQYNTFLWLINRNNIDIKIELNNQIEINNSTIESKNYTNRFILIDAFYIPFESIDILLNKQIEINIQIKNLNQLNQCKFFIQDKYLWKTFIDNHCNSIQSKTLFVQYAKCDFYLKKSIPIDINLLENNTFETTTSNNLLDFNVILSVDTEQLTTQPYSIEPNISFISTTNSTPYYNYNLLIEENYRQILTLITRSTTNSTLLKLTFICLIIILILLIIFFIYMFYYHYYLRLKLSSSIRRSSSLI